MSYTVGIKEFFRFWNRRYESERVRISDEGWLSSPEGLKNNNVIILNREQCLWIQARIEADFFSFLLMSICHEFSYQVINVLIIKGYNVCPKLIKSHYRASVYNKKGKRTKKARESKREREWQTISSKGWKSMNKKNASSFRVSKENLKFNSTHFLRCLQGDLQPK